MLGVGLGGVSHLGKVATLHHTSRAHQVASSCTASSPPQDTFHGCSAFEGEGVGALNVANVKDMSVGSPWPARRLE